MFIKIMPPENSTDEIYIDHSVIKKVRKAVKQANYKTIITEVTGHLSVDHFDIRPAKQVKRLLEAIENNELRQALLDETKINKSAVPVFIYNHYWLDLNAGVINYSPGYYISSGDSAKYIKVKSSYKISPLTYKQFDFTEISEFFRFLYEVYEVRL